MAVDNWGSTFNPKKKKIPFATVNLQDHFIMPNIKKQY